MSFSSAVKNELCRLETGDECCLLSELAGVIKISGTISQVGVNEINVKVVTENAAFARKVYSSFKKAYNVYPEIIIRRSKKLKKHVSYILVITSSMQVKEILQSLGILYQNIKRKKPSGNASSHDTSHIIASINTKELIKKNCCKKAYLRGAFLAGGSISDPEKTYHLEIINHSNALAVEISEIMNGYKLNAKVIKRKGNYVTYLKEGENIVDFLNIIGAHSALMELENVRILKGMRNSVNRIVNCETANLEKTVNASIRQIENIEYIRDNIGFGGIPENLREIAELRLEYSDANLKELGEMLKPPLGKSGVNHRLRKLDKIAENVRKLKGEL